jgi:hypothetical protein
MRHIYLSRFISDYFFPLVLSHLLFRASCFPPTLFPLVIFSIIFSARSFPQTSFPLDFAMYLGLPIFENRRNKIFCNKFHWFLSRNALRIEEINFVNDGFDLQLRKSKERRIKELKQKNGWARRVPSDFGTARRPHHLSAPADATSRFESAGRDTFFTWPTPRGPHHLVVSAGYDFSNRVRRTQRCPKSAINSKLILLLKNLKKSAIKKIRQNYSGDTSARWHVAFHSLKWSNPLKIMPLIVRTTAAAVLLAPTLPEIHFGS